MKIHSRLTSQQSRRYIERKKWRQIVAIVLIVLDTALAGFTLIKILELPLFNIQTIYVSGAPDELVDSIQNRGFAVLQSKYLGILPRSNIFFYPSHELARSLGQLSPQLAKVNINRRGMNTLTITVQERAPEALVCVNLPDFNDAKLSMDDSDDCYFATELGYVYEKAPTYSDGVYNRYYFPDAILGTSTMSGINGFYATSTAEFDKLQMFYAELKLTTIQPLAILAKDNGEYELYVKNPGQSVQPVSASSTDSDTAVVYFNNSRPFRDELINLVSFWKQMVDNAHSRDINISFEYIDVRYGSNVFYRLNN